MYRYIYIYIYIYICIYIYVCISYNTGTLALSDIYAQRLRVHSARGRVRIYQPKHKCLCYN